MPPRGPFLRGPGGPLRITPASPSAPAPFTPVGSPYLNVTGTGTSISMALVNQNIGDLVLIFVRSTTGTMLPTLPTGGGATWAQLGSTFAGHDLTLRRWRCSAAR